MGLREPGFELEDSLELFDRRAGLALAETHASFDKERLAV
jgi:hypothetical protein